MTEMEFRPVPLENAPELLEMIRVLEKEEGFPYPAPVNVESLQSNLLSGKGPGEARFIYFEDQLVGYVVYYFTFSTAMGKKGLHLDDLFIKKEFRLKGLATQAMIKLAEMALEEECARFEWWAMRWNSAAKGFYDRLEANTMDDIQMYRIQEEEIHNLIQRKRQ